MRVGGNFMQQGGSLSLDACKASGSGGGIHVHGSFTQQNGSVANFQACRAEQSGGGLHVQHNIALAGSSKFLACAAERGQDGYFSFAIKWHKGERAGSNQVPKSEAEQNKFQSGIYMVCMLKIFEIMVVGVLLHNDPVF